MFDIASGPGPRARWAATAVAVLATWALFSRPSPAEAQPARQEKATMVVEPAATAAEPGTDAEILISMQIEDGWHTNSNQPTYDYLIATEATIEAPESWEEARVRYPSGDLKTFAFAEEAISVYEGDVLIVATQRLPEDLDADEAVVTVRLTYQACDDRSCLPPVTLTEPVSLVIGEAGVPTAAAERLAATLGDAADAEAAPGRTREGAPESGPGMAWMLLLGLLGGLILNAMPCVLPVLSLKIFGLVKSAGQGRAEVTRGALATSAGILVSFWALALLAVIAKSGGSAVGWGIQFQEPTFVAALTVVVVLFCLNLWGVFEVTLPGGLASAADTSGRQGIAGHFTTGLFATLMATPCSAPFLGTAIGFGLSQSAGTILAIFTAVGIGMAIPYLALAIAPGSARYLPKPGAWMNHLRTAMGFLLAAAAVWLLYVLSAQISAESLAFFEGTLLLMAMLVWWRQTVSRPLPRRLATVAAALAIGLGLWLAHTGESSAAQTVETSSLIEWRAFDRAEAERLAEAGSLVFIDVTADWCFTCKVNERLALETEPVAQSFARHGVVAMKADWTNRSDDIARFLSDHGRYGIPFYLLYRPGSDPHVFGELITSQEIADVVNEAARTRLSSY